MSDTMYRVLRGDCLDVLRTLDANSVHCCVTSPPYYGLRDYGHEGQIGLEESPDAYVAKLVEVFREVRRVLREDGTLWLNLGDSYVASACGVKEGGVSKKSGLHGANRGETYRATLAAGHGHAVDKTRFGLPPKNLIGIPWRVAFALQADGWWLRQDIIWSKPNCMPESVTDRCTKAHEYVFLLSKSERYYYDADAIAEKSVDPESHKGRNKRNGDKFVGERFSDTRSGFSKIESGKTYPTRNKRSVWTVTTKPFTGWTQTSHLVRVERDAASGDTMRITSPDCPCHAGQPDLVPTAFRDERVADQLSRILDKRRLDQERTVAHAPTPQPRVHSISSGSSDSPRQSGAPTATLHSNGSRRTASSSAEGDTACEGTSSHTGCTSPSHVSLGQDGCDSRDSSEISDRTSRRCTCDHYTIESKKSSHFATFPPKLIEPCILAGCPVGGTVLDPFGGSGTTGMVAMKHGRSATLIELNPEYADMAERRIASAETLFA